MSGAPKPASLKLGLTLAVTALVLTISAIVPRGYMIAPSSAHGFEVTACPETNPLARLVAHRQSEEQRKVHAAMGHHLEPSDSAPAAGSSGGDCAFAGLSAPGLAQDFEGWDDQHMGFAPLLLPTGHQRVETRALRLRPPLRGPPINA